MDKKNEDYLNDLISSIQSKINIESEDKELKDESTQFSNAPNDTEQINLNSVLSDLFNSNENNDFKKANNNQIDNRANLLIALKPYLKKSRQNKIDEYISYLNLAKIFNIFNNKEDNNE